MDGRIKKEVRSSGKRTAAELESVSAFEAIELITKHHAKTTDTEEGIDLFLRSWWSRTYNRPLKDPLLLEYSTYDLLYEYNDIEARKNATLEILEVEADKIEEAVVQETEDWIEEEERKEREAAEAALEAKRLKEEQWMLEQLKKQDPSFGDDLNMDFSE